MVYCGSCGTAVHDESEYCPKCGVKLFYAHRTNKPSRAGKYARGVFDETWRFEEADIASSRIAAMLSYLPLGVIVSASLCRKSPFAVFHRRQGWRLLGRELLLLAVGLVLTWLSSLLFPSATGVIRILCAIPGAVFLALAVTGCVTSFRGKALELPLIRAKQK